MKKVKFGILIFLLLISFAFCVNADSIISANRIKDTILQGETVSITVNYPSNATVAEYTLGFNSEAFVLDSSEIQSYVNSVGTDFVKVIDASNKSLTLTFISKSTAEGKFDFTLSDVNVYDNAEKIETSVSNTSVTVRKKSSDATLSSLKVDGKALDVNKLEHTVNANYNATNVTILADVPKYGSIGRGSTGSKTLTGKTSKFEVVSLAEDGTSKTYTITVVKADPLAADLESLSINGNARDIKQITHNVTCNNETKTITIQATGKDKNISCKSIIGATVLSSKDVSNGKEFGISLVEGANKVIITSKASDGNYINYTININRDKYIKSSDATLKSIYVDGVLISRI